MNQEKSESSKAKVISSLTLKEKKSLMQRLGVKKEELKIFKEKTKKDKREIKRENYTLYQPNKYTSLANKYAKKYADSLRKKHPELVKPLFDQFLRVNMPMLSTSYLSLMIFCTVLSFPAGIILAAIFMWFFGYSPILILPLGIFGTILTGVSFYLYPYSLLSERQRNIKNELPFALVHMNAVAGSGANPISIFELLVNSSEYPELKKEIKTILNYVNLFGYNLSTSLRRVAETTPSKELKDLLNGMTSTIETGGDLKGYLKEKSEEALNTYKLDRKKQVDALGTYSEVYTAILIAAPLLMMISLAILNVVGGNIGGMSIKVIGWVSVIVVLPVLNIGFMMFLNSSQKGM